MTSTSPVFSQHLPETRWSLVFKNVQMGYIWNATVRQRIRLVIEIKVTTSKDKLMLIYIDWYTCKNEGL